MSNRDMNVAKKRQKRVRENTSITVEYPSFEQLVAAKEAGLKRVIPELDLSVLLEQIEK